MAADEAGALLEQFLPHLVDQQQAAEALLRQMREVFDAGVFAEQLQEMEEMVGGLGEGQPKRELSGCFLAKSCWLIKMEEQPKHELMVPFG